MDRYKYEFLLAAQLILAALSPLLSSAIDAPVLINIALTIVFVSAMYIISSTRQHFVIGMVLMIPAFSLLWLSKATGSDTLEFISYIFSTLFFCYVVSLILSDIFHVRLITVDVIAGGISVYLFIGNIWGLLYTLIARVDSNAFNIPAKTAEYLGDTMEHAGAAMYFSFVTLTTLGYGDITPVNSFARTLAYLEAAIGQVYLTVLIASLVGMHLASQKGEQL